MADLPPDIEMQGLLCTVGDQTKWRLLYHRERVKIGLFRVTLQPPFCVSVFPFVYMIRPHLFSMCTAFAIVFPHLIPLKLLKRGTWFWPETLVSTKKKNPPSIYSPPPSVWPWEQRDLYTIGKCWGHDIPSVFMICRKPNFSPTETQRSFFCLILGGHVCWFSCALRFFWIEPSKCSSQKRQKKNVDFMVCRFLSPLR